MNYHASIRDTPDLPAHAFRKALGKNRPATLEGGKGGDTPAAPDPYATAAAQTQSNQQTAAYNRYLNLNNFSNPFGSQNTTQIGTGPDGVPIFQTNTTANPQLQGAMNGLFGQIGNSDNTLANAQSSYGTLGAGLGSLNLQLQGLSGSINPQAAQQAQQQGQNAAYASQTQYLDPQFSQQKESLAAQLANQGLTPGSQAYDNAMLNFNNTKQRAYSDAANQAILTGSQIGTQNWQNQLAGVGANAGLFGQIGQNYGQIGDLTGRQVGVSQLPYSNLQTIAQMIPGYQGPATIGTNPADIAGYMNNAYQGQLASHNADVASSNASTSATVGLIGTAAMAAAMYF